MPSDNFAFSMTLPFKQKCQLPDCKRVGYKVSRLVIDGNKLDFCCAQHALVGRDRWAEKKKLGITPGKKPAPTGNPDQMVGDNINEIEEQ